MSEPPSTPVDTRSTGRLTLLVVIGSTRPGRQGDRWATWFADVAREHSGYDVAVADLREVALPFLDEVNHPRLGRYEHEHTKRWAATVRAADALTFVTPEYNYSFPAPLKNALDFLSAEWKDKPAGVVSYGGLSAGVRAVQHLRMVLGALGMFVPQATVAIPFSQQYLDDEGGVAAPDSAVASARAMLIEMQRLGDLLRPVD